MQKVWWTTQRTGSTCTSRLWCNMDNWDWWDSSHDWNIAFCSQERLGRKGTSVTSTGWPKHPATRTWVRIQRNKNLPGNAEKTSPEWGGKDTMPWLIKGTRWGCCSSKTAITSSAVGVWAWDRENSTAEEEKKPCQKSKRKTAESRRQWIRRCNEGHSREETEFKGTPRECPGLVQRKREWGVDREDDERWQEKEQIPGLQGKPQSPNLPGKSQWSDRDCSVSESSPEEWR